MNLKQIDHLQSANQEGLQYLLRKVESGDCDENQIRQEMYEYERAIEENERIRQELLAQFQMKRKERSDTKDQQIDMLKKEVVFLKEQLKQKDQVIEQLQSK